MPRKTDSHNPTDWLLIAESEIEALRVLAGQEISFVMCRSKLAEVVEKVMKAELIRRGWFLEKTHDLERLRKELRARDAELADQLEPLCMNLAEAYFTGRYPGFDLDDADWPTLRAQLDQVTKVLDTVKARVVGK